MFGRELVDEGGPNSGLLRSTGARRRKLGGNRWPEKRTREVSIDGVHARTSRTIVDPGVGDSSPLTLLIGVPRGTSATVRTDQRGVAWLAAPREKATNSAVTDPSTASVEDNDHRGIALNAWSASGELFVACALASAPLARRCSAASRSCRTRAGICASHVGRMLGENIDRSGPSRARGTRADCVEHRQIGPAHFRTVRRTRRGRPAILRCSLAARRRHQRGSLATPASPVTRRRALPIDATRRASAEHPSSNSRPRCTRGVICPETTRAWARQLGLADSVREAIARPDDRLHDTVATKLRRSVNVVRSSSRLIAVLPHTASTISARVTETPGVCTKTRR